MFMTVKDLILDRNIFDYCGYFFSWNDEPYSQSRPHDFSELVTDRDQEGLSSDK